MYDLDVIFLVHVGCSLDSDECNNQIEGVSEFLLNIKRDSSPRTGLIYFGLSSSTLATQFITAIELDDGDFNDLDAPEGSILDRRLELQQKIRLYGEDSICPYAVGTTSTSDLTAAIEEAKTQFTIYDIQDSETNEYRQKKLVIVSNCKDDNENSICQTYGNNNRIYINGQEVEITVINVGDITNTDSTYLECLTDLDPNQLINIPEISHDAFANEIDDFTNELCTEPTLDPTADPTSDPTKDPTRDPTKDPTADPTKDPTRDPTADPTRDPTADPTADPTKDPTADPTVDPTRDPTSDPTIDPTADPTKNPTYLPTISPIVGICDELSSNPDRKLDVAVIVDRSTIFGENDETNDENKECHRYNEFVAEVVSSFKTDEIADNVSTNDDDPAQVRIAYYVFGTEEIPSNIGTYYPGGANTGFFRVISLTDANINELPTSIYKWIL